MQDPEPLPADTQGLTPGDEKLDVVTEKLNDDASAFGRMKAPPVCLDTTLQKESMSTETLQQWVFSADAVVPSNANQSQNPYSSSGSRSSAVSTVTMVTTATAPLITTATPDGKPQVNQAVAASNVSVSVSQVPVSVVSISSNNSCGDSHAALSSDETKNSEEQLNAKVALRKTSRQGRSSQRWATTSPGEGVRLTTGCVPILRTGKVLFVSASRKPAWILPKGGWEQDESMEESAIRECFEEAGCLGTLGPALAPVHYETRKAKKRRMDHEHIIRQHKKIAKTDTPATKLSSILDEDKSVEDSVVEKCNTEDSIPKTPQENSPKKEERATQGSNAAVLTDQAIARIRGTTSTGSYADETMSVGSMASATYSHAQMTLFPLYVRKIESTWPESGRFRKAVDIDEAIEMLAERPELKAALQQVKQRGLHKIQDPAVAEGSTNQEESTTNATLE